MNIPKISFQKSNPSTEGIEIFSLQSLFQRRKRLDHQITEPHRVGFYIVILIKSGRGSHFIDFQEHDFAEGSLILVSQNQVQAFAATDVEGEVILFTEDFLSRYATNFDHLALSQLYNHRTPIVQPDKAEGMEIQTLVAQISREYDQGSDFAKGQILSLLLKTLLLRAERCQQTTDPTHSTPSYVQKFSSFQRLLADQLRGSRNAHEYADQIGISYKHLNTICKDVCGMTVKAYIDQAVIIEIKRELVLSAKNIQELSFEFGFYEDTNFVKFFKKHVGMPPAEFRKRQSQALPVK